MIFNMISKQNFYKKYLVEDIVKLYISLAEIESYDSRSYLLNKIFI